MERRLRISKCQTTITDSKILGVPSCKNCPKECKSVEKLTGTTNPFDGKVDNRGHKQLLEFSKTGKQQSIILLSENTVPITAPKTKSEEPVIEQTEQSIVSDSKDIEL